jgi:plasmid maintenance system killer protein
VISTCGAFAITDSLGKYSVTIAENDSLIFYYKDKPTQKFSIKSMSDPNHFDISLHVNVKSKYSMLKEVMVFSKSHKQDSIENRETYHDIFGFSKPGLNPTVSNGVAGADLDELINVFRFRRTKRLKAFQHRLENEEQEKYIDYRFSKVLVKRITGLQSPYLDTFLVWYRPGYEFARNSDELSFNQYVLNASYQFQRIMGIGPAKKEEPAQ